MKQKPKVCHFSSVHHLEDTRVFYRECKSLATVFDVTYIGLGHQQTVRDGVRLIGIKRQKNPLVRLFTTRYMAFYLAVKEDAALYHIHDAEMIPLGILLSILGKPVIYDIHENTAQDILLKTWLKPKAKILLSTVYKQLLRIGNYFMHYIPVVANERYLPDFSVREGHYTVIQNFASIHEMLPFRVNQRSTLPGQQLFYVGMIKDMYYDMNPVLEAIYLLKQQGLVVHLHCVGYFGTDTVKTLDEVPYWNEIKDQVTYYGKLPMREAYAISRQCKLGICLKNQPEQMVVSHERKLFEYMAIGLPSIFCENAIYQELNAIQQIGISLNLAEPSAIAAAIHSLLNDPMLLDKLASQNIQLTERIFNWEHEEVRLKGLYWTLLNQK